MELNTASAELVRLLTVVLNCSFSVKVFKISNWCISSCPQLLADFSCACVTWHYNKLSVSVWFVTAPCVCAAWHHMKHLSLYTLFNIPPPPWHYWPSASRLCSSDRLIKSSAEPTSWLDHIWQLLWWINNLEVRYSDWSRVPYHCQSSH